MKKPLSVLLVIFAILILFILGFVLSLATTQKIDMDIIAQIESNNNPQAINRKSGAVGKYQITDICLRDYNQFHTVKYNMADMIDSEKNFDVAQWYISQRIPQLLKARGKPTTAKNILIAYNAGFEYVGEKLPTETENYIKKYYKLQR